MSEEPYLECDVFKYLNKKHDTQFNCVSLTLAIYKDVFNFSIDLNTDFYMGWVKQRQIDIDLVLGKYFTKIKLAEAKKYDILTFGKNKIITHIAVYLGNYKIIHVLEDKPCCIDNLQYYMDNLNGIYRLQ